MLTPLSPFDVRDMLAKGARLIDVRSAGEFAQEHIEGAESMPLPNVPPLEGDAPLIFMCLSGARVASSEPMLRAAAGGKGYVLEGSLLGWKRAGLPVVSGGGSGGFLGQIFGRR